MATVAPCLTSSKVNYLIKLKKKEQWVVGLVSFIFLISFLLTAINNKVMAAVYLWHECSLKPIFTNWLMLFKARKDLKGQIGAKCSLCSS